MRKKDVRTANLLMLNSMVKPSYINNVSVETEDRLPKTQGTNTKAQNPLLAMV